MQKNYVSKIATLGFLLVLSSCGKSEHSPMNAELTTNSEGVSNSDSTSMAIETENIALAENNTDTTASAAAAQDNSAEAQPEAMAAAPTAPASDSPSSEQDFSWNKNLENNEAVEGTSLNEAGSLLAENAAVDLANAVEQNIDDLAMVQPPIVVQDSAAEAVSDIVTAEDYAKAATAAREEAQQEKLAEEEKLRQAEAEKEAAANEELAKTSVVSEPTNEDLGNFNGKVIFFNTAAAQVTVKDPDTGIARTFKAKDPEALGSLSSGDFVTIGFDRNDNTVALEITRVDRI